MPVSVTPALERIARVLAGQKLSANAGGEEAHAGAAVDMEWVDCLDTARAILRTLREPDAEMAAVGDFGAWQRMIAVALSEEVGPKS